MSTRSFETEHQLINAAMKRRRRGQDTKDLETRLYFLRAKLGESFPGYKSRFPRNPFSVTEGDSTNIEYYPIGHLQPILIE